MGVKRVKAAGAGSCVNIAVLWSSVPGTGCIEVVHGKLLNLKAGSGGRTKGNGFGFSGNTTAGRLEITIGNARLAPGADPTVVRVQTETQSFAFFLRDISSESPLYIPAYGVAVTEVGDRRDYATIAAAVQARKLVSVQGAIEAAPEETYETACRRNRKLMCPTWLGLGRDMRIFEVGYRPEYGFWGYIQPRYHSTLQAIPETGGKPYVLNFCLGPGASCQIDLSRRLEEGGLPILHSTQKEADVVYHLTAFTTLETRPLAPDAVRGSDWRAVYPNTGGHMLAPEAREKVMAEIGQAEMSGREEETVCCLRVEAVNTGRVPRYAWVRGIHPQGPFAQPPSFDDVRGFSVLASGRVLAVNRLNGGVMPQEEMAVLLPPGGTAVYEFLIPHQPLPSARAARLSALDLTAHLTACRKFWKAKLQTASRIQVPEAAIDERIRAGLLHCDLVALGKEPDGTVLATIGWYSPIGSESAPIIQFFDSMGWHHLAERSLQFFLDRQQDDGFIQNFAGYQLETGPALWTMGEHFRYTRDVAWVRRIKPKVLKACDYLLKWRERNKLESLRGKGYGLLDGKVADPQDFYHSFMLNAVSYLGLQRAAEMLAAVAPADARRLAAEVKAYGKDIRTAYDENLAKSPAIPLGDGTWIPSIAPWSEYSGPLALYAEGGKWWTHGTFGGRDSMIGPLYLMLTDLFSPAETAVEVMLKVNQELFTISNAALSQPYYCRHDYTHLLRGEVKAYLKLYYNQMTALQDRETYTFWEHYFHASQHKTHEEGWFLMQTRWMLYLEEGSTLHFLKAIPRRWLEAGKTIGLQDVASYFGPVSLQVESRLDEGLITAVAECQSKRPPKEITIRLPHPEGRKAVRLEGPGEYDPGTETVRIADFKKRAAVVLRFL